MSGQKGKKDKGKRRGRPTAYRREWCGAIIEHFREDANATLEDFAAKVCHVSAVTLWGWRRARPEFAAAVETALGCKRARLLRWMMETAAGDRPGNAGLLAFLALNYNVFPREGTARTDGPGGGGCLAARRARAGLTPRG